MVATMLVAILLPAGIAYYPVVVEYFTPEIIPQTVEDDPTNYWEGLWCPED